LDSAAFANKSRQKEIKSCHLLGQCHAPNVNNLPTFGRNLYASMFK